MTIEKPSTGLEKNAQQSLGERVDAQQFQQSLPQKFASCPGCRAIVRGNAEQGYVCPACGTKWTKSA
jgi:uncharacterized paraquat-inducible protein A